ncbi:hypothetical protein AYI69_g6468 [Smittium culicis]|uniref:Uncharacterized protein n=1 Tax=Smittium culicis TaxID=133412 RepID=A0A1R1XYV7_9FUNG|nr:hypothetical protein AYI69_g6468 [Smittium culicis]
MPILNRTAAPTDLDCCTHRSRLLPLLLTPAAPYCIYLMHPTIYTCCPSLQTPSALPLQTPAAPNCYHLPLLLHPTDAPTAPFFCPQLSSSHASTCCHLSPSTDPICIYQQIPPQIRTDPVGRSQPIPASCAFSY